MDALSLLRLQLSWGADEALALDPISRIVSRPADAATITQPLAPTRSPARVPDAAASDAATSGPALSWRGATPASAPPLAPPAPASPVAASTVPASAAGQAAPAPVREQAPPIRRPATAGDTATGRGPASEARAVAVAAVDLDALRSVIAAFAQCGLRDTATHSVLPTGTVDATPPGHPIARIAIVGEVPDEDEDRAGHPFAGRAGELLDRMLASIGLHRDQLLLLPLIPWRPPGGRAPNPIEMTTCQPFLDRALELAQPRFILCMGSRPARVVADSVIRAGASWRKPVIAGLGTDVRVLAMRHPSYLLSHLPARREAWGDLIRLKRALDVAETAGSITDA